MNFLISQKLSWQRKTVKNGIFLFIIENFSKYTLVMKSFYYKVNESFPGLAEESGCQVENDFSCNFRYSAITCNYWIIIHCFKFCCWYFFPICTLTEDSKERQYFYSFIVLFLGHCSIQIIKDLRSDSKQEQESLCVTQLKLHHIFVLMFQ